MVRGIAHDNIKGLPRSETRQIRLYHGIAGYRFSLNLLKNAKSLCDKLIVGVSTDELVSYKNKKSVIPFKERTEIIKKILPLKAYKKEIIDKKRISTILKKIKKESFKRNIDPKITHRIWKNMIWSYINFEKKNFKKK